MSYRSYPALARTLYLLARPVLRLKKHVSELVIVDKVIEKQGTTWLFVPRNEYYVTPEGWTSSLEVTAEQFERISVGDVIKATWTPYSREILWFDPVGQVDAEYPLVISTPDYERLDLENNTKLTKYFMLTALVLTLLYWLFYVLPSTNTESDPLPIKTPLILTTVFFFLLYRYLRFKRKLDQYR
jgi:hypothetical protein